MEDFKVSGNSLGAYDWDGRSGQWWTGGTDGGHWEDINCGAHFKYDLNYYLQSAGTHWRSVQVCGLPGGTCLCQLCQGLGVVTGR